MTNIRSAGDPWSHTGGRNQIISCIRNGTYVPLCQEKYFRCGSSMDKIWERIDLLRQSRSLAAFCREADLNYDTMRKCFQRKNAPDAKSLARIAGQFRVHLPWLITGETTSNRQSIRIGKRLKQMRKTRGLESESFAEMLGMSPKILEFYERKPVRSGLLACTHILS